MTDLQRCYLAWLLAAATAAAMCANSSAALAQDRGLARSSYARGVHAFFALSSAEAEQQFTQAMQDDPDDPRPYYFRGLCLLRQGRSDEARSDFMSGAALEARGPGRYPVGRSLERVQGSDRLVLEGYRRQARQAGAIGRSQRSRTQYGQSAATDADVLRQKATVPLERLVRPGTLTDWKREPARPQMPKQATPLAVTPDRGTPKAVEPQNDPFADDPRPPTAAKAKEVDPFAVDAASDQPEGTVPSGKLIGILGRALRQAAPLPSLEGLRQQLPPLPVPGAAGQPPNAAGGFGAEPGAFPNAESDPFGEGASETEDANGSREEPAPTDAPEEDPFGGF